MGTFVHLASRSCYSLREGVMRPRELAEEVAARVDGAGATEGAGLYMVVGLADRRGLLFVGRPAEHNAPDGFHGSYLAVRRRRVVILRRTHVPTKKTMVKNRADLRLSSMLR